MSKPNHDSPHTPEGHTEAHGSSVGFYIFIAVVLGVITYSEFALVEHQDTWFAWMSRFWLFFWLIALSIVKFVLVVMFFMHLKQDHRAFTGFFSSGMVIAVGTLAALGALFSVRSIAEAQTLGEPHTEAHAEEHGEAQVGLEDTRSLIERFEHPAPKTQDVTRTELRPTVAGSQDGSGAGLGADVLAGEGESTLPRASVEDPNVTPTGLVAGTLPFPLAEPASPVTLPNPFAADGAPQGDALPTDEADAEAVTEAGAADTAGEETDTGTDAADETADDTVTDTETDTEADTAAQEATADEAADGTTDEAATTEAADETAGDAAAAVTGPPADAPLLLDADLSLGESAYSANCAACHQAGGQGLPGAFPPLVGHTPDLAQAEGGRGYLVNLLLYGLQGQIEVDGQSYNGVMPPWQPLSDEELASVLNYTLSEWDNLSAMPEDYVAFTAEEVAAQRDAGLSAADVYEQRGTLDLP